MESQRFHPNWRRRSSPLFLRNDRSENFKKYDYPLINWSIVRYWIAKSMPICNSVAGCRVAAVMGRTHGHLLIAGGVLLILLACDALVGAMVATIRYSTNRVS
jgi:hypothetical protein